MKSIEEIEEKWFKECERFSNIIDEYKKGDKDIKKHPEFVELKRVLKLTEYAYNKIAEERDKLKERIKENWKMFEEELKSKIKGEK